MSKSNKNDENIFAEERKQLIINLVNKQVKTTVSDLCAEFNVSPATIRNDLRELEFAGLLKRTHGGAISNKKASFDKPYQARLVEYKAEKQAIGKLASTMVQKGDKIIIDVGTTTIELAMCIANIPDLTVVTNDLQVAYYLGAHSDAFLLVTGGFLRPRYNNLYGEIAIRSLEGINVDKAFFSAEAISLEKGATNTNVNVALLKSEYVKHTDQVIVLCDHTKFGKSAFYKFADIEDIDIIVTDEYTDKKTLEQYSNHNIDMEIARLEKPGTKAND